MTLPVSSSNAEFDSVLYQALAEPIGLLIEASDISKCRAKLYHRRAALADPALFQLQIRLKPEEWEGEGNLVIVKGPRPQALAKPLPAGLTDELDL